MAALQRNQLSKLCSSTETFEKALSILRIANAKTGPGSGFVVKSSVAIPAVCAYLASEQLNTGEVSLQSATSAACVTRTEFADILNKLRATLCTGEGNTVRDVTYEMLVDAYHVHPREDAVACMEDAEAALPRADILKDKYGANILTCAVFYWVCQLMEEPSVQERSLRQSYSIPPKTFKAVVATLDKQCDGIADQIKTYLLPKRSTAEASTSQPDCVSKHTPTSPKKSPMKSTVRPQTRTNISTPATTPSKKRTVTFSHLSTCGDGGHEDSTSFPETPTKKRRIDSSSPTKPRTGSSPAKRSLAASTTAFHAALKDNSTKLPVGQESEIPDAGPSTPRRPRRANVAEATATPVQANSQPSPSRSQNQASPTRSVVRRHFRPIFLEQQQWCARDPKVERMWAVAETVRDEMVALHGHPFQRMWQRGGEVVEHSGILTASLC